MATLQTDTLVDQYFHEIESSAGLSAAEEVEIAKHIQDGDEAALKDLVAYNGANMAKDRDGNLVFMAKSAWDIGYQQERHPQVKFSATRER